MMHLNFIIHTMLVGASELPGCALMHRPPWTCSFTLGSKPLMESAEYCLTRLTRSQLKCMNGCTCFCCCPARWWNRFYADLSAEKCLHFSFKFGYTAASFCCCCCCCGSCQLFPNNKMQCKLFFFFAFNRLWLWCCAAGSAFSGFES